jgi:hypothetical protein
LFEGQKKTLSRQTIDLGPELYGHPNDPLCERIPKKVWAWQQEHKKGIYYNKILPKFKVIPYHFRDPKTLNHVEQSEPAGVDQAQTKVQVQKVPATETVPNQIVISTETEENMSAQARVSI